MKKQLNTAMAAALVLGSLSAAGADRSDRAKVRRQPRSKDGQAGPKGEAARRDQAGDRDIRELQEKLAAQQAQIDTLMQQNAAKDAALSHGAAVCHHGADQQPAGGAVAGAGGDRSRAAERATR